MVIDAKSPYTFRHSDGVAAISVEIGRFRGLAEVAASHHERLDGVGYHRGIGAAELSGPALCPAVFEALEQSPIVLDTR